MTKINLENTIIKAKITILEPIYNCSGTIYYAGFVNDIYTHFLGYNKLNKKELKIQLLKKYIKDGFLVDRIETEEYYGR